MVWLDRLDRWDRLFTSGLAKMAKRIGFGRLWKTFREKRLSAKVV